MARTPRTISSKRRSGRQQSEARSGSTAAAAQPERRAARKRTPAQARSASGTQSRRREAVGSSQRENERGHWAETIRAAMRSPLGREVLASVLVAAAGAAATVLRKNAAGASSGAEAPRLRQEGSSQEGRDTGVDIAAATRALAGTAAGALADVMTNAARSFLPASHDGAGRVGSGGTEGQRGG